MVKVTKKLISGIGSPPKVNHV